MKKLFTLISCFIFLIHCSSLNSQNYSSGGSNKINTRGLKNIGLNKQSAEASLHKAILNGNLQYVSTLLSHGVDPNKRDAAGNTYLHLVSKRRNTQFISLLLKHGANVNVKNKNGETPLHWVSKNGNIQTASILLKHGANVNERDKNGNTPLHWASKNRNLELASFFLKKGAHPNAKNENSETPLHLTMYNGEDHKNRNLKIVYLLLKNGADVNIKNENGEFPLHLAHKHSGLKFILLLLKHGANVNVNVKNKNDKTLIEQAISDRRNKNLKLVHLLLKYGADVNTRTKNGNTLWDWAIGRHSGNIQTISMLLKYGLNVNTKNKNGETPLHFASENGRLKLASLLLKHSADINVKNKKNHTPLHRAVIKKHINIISLLLKYKADVNVKDQKGQAPLHFASYGSDKNKRFKIASLLLKYRANINIKDKDGETPLDYAMDDMYYDETLVKLFKSKGGLNGSRNKNTGPILIPPIAGTTIYMDKNLRPITDPKKIEDFKKLEQKAWFKGVTVNGSKFLSGVYEKGKIKNLLYPNELFELTAVHNGIIKLHNQCIQEQDKKNIMPVYKRHVASFKKNHPKFDWPHGRAYQKCYNNMYCQNYSAYKGIGRKIPEKLYSRIRKDCVKYVTDRL